MRLSMPALAAAIVLAVSFLPQFANAQTYTQRYSQVPIPGRGQEIDYVGDKFEDPEWSFVHNMPKSSSELNDRTYGPMGYSKNRRWNEGPMRGQPDFMKVIKTPPGGLPDSKGALQISTLRSGIPNNNTNTVEQDDLIMNVSSRLGTTIQAHELPSCVVRVYLPEPKLWENRSGPHFGIRLGVRTTIQEQRTGLFAMGSKTVTEPYWPGIWVHFRSETSRNVETDSAYLKIRGTTRGNDFKSKEIPVEQFGWWTFGMSISADGQIHYFGKPGVENLTMADHLSSQYPYGFKAERMSSFFFNICNNNNGRTWSTPFVIDDPSFYVANATRIQQVVQRKVDYENRRAQAAAERAEKQRQARAAAQEAAKQRQAKAKPQTATKQR